MLPPDNHVHSEFSWDTGPWASMVETCERAVRIGLPAVAFTEHLDFTVWAAEDRATDEGLVDRHASRHAEIDVEASDVGLENAGSVVTANTPKPPKTAGERVTDEGDGGTKVAEYLVGQKLI